MRIPDVNVLLYAFDAESPPHDTAKAWLEKNLSGGEAVGLTWIVIVAFLRLSTGAVFEAPLAPAEAMDEIDRWLEQPAVSVVEPTERHTAVLREVLDSGGRAGNLANDAHVAAIAIEHNATVVTFDGDFHRFSGLKLEYLG